MGNVLPLATALVLLSLSVACGQSLETASRRDPAAPEQIEANAPNVLDEDESDLPEEEEEVEENGMSMSEILRSARPAPMPHEEPESPDETADAENAEVIGYDLETGEPISEPGAQTNPEDAKGQVMPSEPPEPSAVSPEKGKDPNG